MAARSAKRQVRRLFAAALQLQLHPRGIRVEALAEKLGVSRATAYRDLDSLEDVPIPLIRDKVNGESRVRLHQRTLQPMVVTPLQRLALRIARAELPAFDGTEVGDGLDEILGAPTSSELPAKIATDPKLTRHDSGLARTLRAAIDAGDCVVLRYQHGTSSPVTERTAAPVQLRVHEGSLYVAAWDVAKEQWRIFKLARLLGVRRLRGNPCPRPAYDADAVFGSQGGIWIAPEEEVRVLIAPHAVQWVREHPLDPSQQLKVGADGSVEVALRTRAVPEVFRQVLRWGAGATILSPAHLRRAAREELERALRNHRDDPLTATPRGVSRS